MTSGAQGVGWLSSETARGPASTLVSENNPIFSSTVICQAPAISRINYSGGSRKYKLIYFWTFIWQSVAWWYKETYRHFHPVVCSQEPFPAGDGGFHTVFCEHLQRRPAQMVQEQRVAVWKHTQRQMWFLRATANISVWTSGTHSHFW